MAKLPSLDHINLLHRSQVYEPAEDTYLLCDAIENDREFLRSLSPTIVCEIGCGSGCVLTFISNLLKEEGIYSHAIGIDINPHASLLTKTTASLNQVSVDTIIGDLLHSMVPTNMFDIMIFNPPYVPTPSEEIHGNGIEVSWAGGKDGREIIDQFLPQIKTRLSPGGVCYMVLVIENKPQEVMNYLMRNGFICQICLRRRASNEDLMILKIIHSSSSSSSSSSTAS